MKEADPCSKEQNPSDGVVGRKYFTNISRTGVSDESSPIGRRRRTNLRVCVDPATRPDAGG